MSRRFRGVAFGLALLVTIGWVALVVWRLRVKPQALWRGTVLSAGGLTATWILLVLLWQPAVDYARSYRIMSGQLAQALEQNLRPGECVRGLSLGSGQRASFLIFNNLTFTFDSAHGGAAANHQPEPARQHRGLQRRRRGAVASGRRADRHEVFRLLRVTPNR